MPLMLEDDLVQVQTKVLVVEDDETSRKALVQILKLHHFEVEFSATLQGAMEHLEDGTRVVLLDLMLPDGNGMDVLSAIRRRDLPIKVAVITGAGMAMVESARALGPDRVFTKPLDVAGLIDWLEDPGHVGL